MLTNRIIFARLMALLRSINPRVPLPDFLEPDLWEHMTEEPITKKGRVLEERFEKHQKAYYVVTGFVLVFAFDLKNLRHCFRFYRKNTIVALDAFMNQTESEYMIWACPRAVVWSISRYYMQCIYNKKAEMELMAEKTAAKFHLDKERLRAGFLMLPDELRVLKFYKEKEFRDLLPARRSPVLDLDIADYVALDLVRFRRVRTKLRGQGLL